MKHKRLSAILSAVLMLPAMLQFSMPASAAKVKTLGDVNADGTVNISDGVALSRYVAKWDGITIDKDAADLNQDGEIKKEDVTILLRYLVGWDGYDKYIKPISLPEEDPLRIDAQPEPFSIDYGEDAKLSVKAAGGTAPYTYQWSYNGEDISGATKAEYVPEKGGNYRCIITDDDGAVINSQTAKCSIHPIIKTQPVDGADNFHVEVAGGTNLTYHWEKEVLGEWRVQRESYGAGYGATSVGKYRCVITDFDGYELTSDVVRWYGKGELTVSNIYLDPDEDANYGLTIDFTHHKVEHMRYPVGYYTDWADHGHIAPINFVRYTQEELEAGVQIPGDVYMITYYDYNTPVCAPYAASGLYGDYLDLYVDATGEGPLFFDWQLSPTFDQALAGKGFVSISEKSGALGLGTEHLRFPMKENEDIVHCYGYVRCIVTDRNGNSKTAVFGNPWDFSHEMFMSESRLTVGGNGPSGGYLYRGKVGGITKYAYYWYRDGAQELALWGCKAPTFKELPEEPVSGAELPLNPLADVPTAPVVDANYTGEIVGDRDLMWECGYLKLDAESKPSGFAEVKTILPYTAPSVEEYVNTRAYQQYPGYRWKELEDADGTATNCSMYPRDYAGSDPYEICRKDGTYLPAVSLNLYLYNMHEPSCQLPHDERHWFGSEGGFAYRGAKEGGQSTPYLYYSARPYWWGEFCEPLYEPWYTEKVRYLYAYADHPVTVRNPESFMVIIDDIDLEQAENGDPNNIVTYNKNRGLFKDLSAEEIHAMLPIKLEGGDVCEWTSWNSDGWIDSLFTKTGGHIYCVCEYSDGTKEYYHSTPLDIGCTVTLNGMGTYKASASDGADPITQILDLDDFSLEDAKKALPYKLRTGMDSYSALRAAEKLKKLGLEVVVTCDGAALPEPPKEPEKDEWTVTLEVYSQEDLIDIIKAYKALMPEITGESISLATAKQTVESAPCVLMEKATKEQAEQIKTTLEAAGAVVTYKAYEGGGT